MGAAASSSSARRPHDAVVAAAAPLLPPLSAPQPGQPEFCSRMAFKLTPSHSSRLAARLRWQAVLCDARGRAGGAWAEQFDADAALTPARLAALGRAIDHHFFHGSFHEVCRPSYKVAEALEGQVPGLSRSESCAAVAGFEPSTNAIVVYKSAWRSTPPPSLAAPLQADGAVVTSRLEWLVHTLGHEMLHCLVANACPAAASSAAYAVDAGHGAVFARLNRHVFGHSACRFQRGLCRLHPRVVLVTRPGGQRVRGDTGG